MNTTITTLIVFFALFVSINCSSAHEPPSSYWKQKNKGKVVAAPYRPNPGRVTCDWYPRVCHVKGSPGPDCCKKKCVNVKSDKLNCGMCGNKCRFPEVCCKGNCVNPLHDRKNCGACGNKCRRGSFCQYGMCSYA